MIGVKDKNQFISHLSEFGLTGCLTFYSVNFFNTNIHSTDGYCEDAINIIDGSGKINSIKVENAVSDGVDFDFSKLNINLLDILNAGNDCSDFSYGFYKIERIISSVTIIFFFITFRKPFRFFPAIIINKYSPLFF